MTCHWTSHIREISVSRVLLLPSIHQAGISTYYMSHAISTSIACSTQPSPNKTWICLRTLKKCFSKAKKKKTTVPKQKRKNQPLYHVSIGLLPPNPASCDVLKGRCDLRSKGLLRWRSRMTLCFEDQQYPVGVPSSNLFFAPPNVVQHGELPLKPSQTRKPSKESLVALVYGLLYLLFLPKYKK